MPACSSGTCPRTRRRWRPGPLVTTAGEVIGEHDGYARYTIGQRKGLPGGFAEARFVVAIRPERREVVIGTADELAGHRVRLEELNWLADPLEAGGVCEVQIRHRARAVPATVIGAADGSLELALDDAGPSDHAGTVRCAVWRRRSRAWRRRDRGLADSPHPETSMRSLLLHWLFNAIALWVAAYFITGLDFNGDLLHLLLVAAVFGIVNSLLRPAAHRAHLPAHRAHARPVHARDQRAHADGDRLALGTLEPRVRGRRASGRRSGAGWWWGW